MAFPALDVSRDVVQPEHTTPAEPSVLDSAFDIGSTKAATDASFVCAACCGVPRVRVAWICKQRFQTTRTQMMNW